MFNHFFNHRIQTISFAAGLMFFSNLVSRFLGLIRDRLLASKFGAGEELDVYFAAFRIPDFVYGIIVVGGIVAVFLPVFAEYHKKSEKESWELTSNVLNCFLVLLLVVCGFLAIFTPWLMKFIAPGFSEEQKILATNLTRIMFLSPIFFGLSSVFSGILHYFHKFLVYAIAPILYNLSIITGILFFLPLFGIWGLAFGVVLGAFLYWVIQIPSAKSSGFRYIPLFNFKHPGLMKVFKLMIPRTIGSAAYYLNLIVVTAIASTLKAGSISIFNFANNLQYLPIGLVGISFATVVFPDLSKSWAEGAKDKFVSYFSSAFRQILFLIVPLSALMLILSFQIVRLVLGAGEFDLVATKLTSASLAIFCFGIFAFTFIPFLARVFYSFQDTKTPALVGVAAMVLNVILAFLLVWLFSFSNYFESFFKDIFNLENIRDIAVLALPLSVSLAGIFQFLLLLLYLKKRMGAIKALEIWHSFGRVLLGTLLMALSTYSILKISVVWIDTRTFNGLLFQTLFSAFIGALVYILFFSLLNSPEWKRIWFLIRRD